MHRNTWLATLLGAALLTLGACGDDDQEPPGPTGGGGEGAGGEGGGPPDLPPTSAKALVKLKAGARFRNDVAQALDLELGYCSELGIVGCTDAHFIVMGGADAFFSGLYEPLPETTATSPLAFDRLAMSGCVARADLDMESAELAAIFQGLPLGSDGELTDPSAPAVAAAITRLYQRALGRDPTPTETAALVELYGAIADRGGAQPARDWAVLSCFAVLTTMENIFY